MLGDSCLLERAGLVVRVLARALAQGPGQDPGQGFGQGLGQGLGIGQGLGFFILLMAPPVRVSEVLTDPCLNS